MNPLFYFRSLQNTVSFGIRSKIAWRRMPRPDDPVITSAEPLRAELAEFLDMFDWSVLKAPKKIRAADIGTRDFSFAPVFEKLFGDLGFEPEIHGLEIDAQRRYSNLHSRADYGAYYASRLRHGAYHDLDFLKWHQKLNVAFMLHPFVTPEPPLRWGLPLSAFKPQQLFDHAFGLLKGQGGILLLSAPTEKEFQIARAMAQRAGFAEGEKQEWRPRAETSHRKPRYGIILKTS